MSVRAISGPGPRQPDKMPLSAWLSEDTDASDCEKVIRWKVPVFLPDSRARQAWQLLMAIPLLWTGTVMPYRLSFVSFRTTSEGVNNDELRFTGWDGADYAVDALFIMDLFLNFTFAFYDGHGNLVQQPSQIARAYLKGAFWLDVLACLPHQIFVVLFQSVPGTQKILRLPRLYRLFRLARIGRIIRLRKLKNARFTSGIVSTVSRVLGTSRSAHVAKLIFVLCLLAHLMGCLWYLIAAFGEPDEIWLANRGISDESNFTHWLHSIYLVLTTFTTVGFGDIQPVTDAEAAVAVLLMTTGAVVNSMIVSEVIAVLTRVDGMAAETRRKQAAMEKYADVIGIRCEAFKGRMTKFCEHTTHAKYASLQKSPAYQSALVWNVIFDLPQDVQMELLPQVFGGALLKNTFFRVKADVASLALAVSAHLSSRIFTEHSAKNIVYSFGDGPTGMYLIQEGVMTHVGVPSERGGIADPSRYAGFMSDASTTQYPYQLSGYNGYVGEWELIYPHPRVSTVRAEGNVNSLYLPRHGFLQLVSSFPQFFESMKRTARRREERRIERLKRHKFELDVITFAVVSVQKSIRGFRARAAVRRRRNKLMQGTKKIVHSQMIIRGVGAKCGRAQTSQVNDLSSEQPAADSAISQAGEAASGSCAVPVSKNPVAPISGSARADEEYTSDVKSNSDVIQEAERLFNPSAASTTMQKENGSQEIDHNSQEKLAVPATSQAQSKVVSQQASIDLPGKDRKDASDHHLRQSLTAMKKGSNAVREAKVEDMPPWGRAMQKSIGAIGNQVEQLRKNQEEMAMMMQQLYFLTFSSERSSPVI